MKQNQKDDRQWPDGVLREEIIKKDIKRGTLPGAIALTVATLVLGITAWPVLMATTDMDLRAVALLVGTCILAVLAYRQWCGVLTKVQYRIEEDRIVGKQVQTIYEDKDAELTGMATRVPMLELEKHGLYRIESEQINGNFRAYELYHMMEEGEGLYLVYAQKNDKLLRIYRQKYWTLE